MLDDCEVSAGGVGNNAYIFFLGMLMAQFTLTGYDAYAPFLSPCTPSACLPARLLFMKSKHRYSLGDRGMSNASPSPYMAASW